MKHFLKKELLKTGRHSRFYDITKEVEKAVRESSINDGHVLVQSVHATAGLYINEGEERLLEDFILYLNRGAPEGRGLYLHDDIAERDCPDDEPLNGHSHIKSALYSNPSVNLVLYRGELQLGKYQRIFFAEFDGPCPRKHKSKRKYLVSIIGE